MPAVYAMRGAPVSLVENEKVSVKITVEKQHIGTHRIFVNRGAASSQVYDFKFGGKSPDEWGTVAAMGRNLSRSVNTSLTTL